MRKYLFPILLALSALSLAGAAAFFSVTGLSKLFGGAKMEVIVMASALEFAKLVTASFLHRYWKSLKWTMKTYLTIGVVTVMIITSAGIYGFLSNAYSTTSGKLQNIDAQVQLVEQKKTIINSEITRLQETKDLKSDRVKALTTLRTQQEARVDSLYNRRQSSLAKRVEGQIEQANTEIATSGVEIDTLNSQIQRKYNEISAMDLEVLNLKNNDINGEVGPLKYIANLTGKDMDSVVNFFILLLIFVFDPLAVSLVIATNIAFRKELGLDTSEVFSFKKKEEKKNEEPIVETKEVPAEEKKNASEEAKSNLEDYMNASSEEEKNEDSETKKNEVISYVADENGEFKPTTVDMEKEKQTKVILEQIKAEGIEHNASYLNFLDVLYDKGNVKVGEILPPYSAFLRQLNTAGYTFTENEVISFLTICNLFKITDMSGPVKKVAKEYSVAKEIISLLSK